MGSCALFNFVVWGLIGGALCAFGYVGNLLSVFALQRENRTPTTTLLQSLAVSDLVLLLSVCITDAVPYICAYTGRCYDLWQVWPYIRYVWVLTPVSHMCSIWLVVLIAGNRFWAVCRPHTTGQVWTNRRTCVYIFCVIFVVIVFNVPRFFEYSFTDKCSKPRNADGTSMSAGQTNKNVPSNRSSDESVNDMSSDDGGEAGISLKTVTPSAARDYTAVTAVTVDVIGALSVVNDYVIDVMNNKNMGFGNGSGNSSTCKVKEEKSAFGENYSYRVVYKVVLVNAVLVLLPLAFLLVSSIWIVRALRLSHHMSTKRSMSSVKTTLCNSPLTTRATTIPHTKSTICAANHVDQQTLNGKKPATESSDQANNIHRAGGGLETNEDRRRNGEIKEDCSPESRRQAKLRHDSAERAQQSSNLATSSRTCESAGLTHNSAHETIDCTAVSQTPVDVFNHSRNHSGSPGAGDQSEQSFPSTSPHLTHETLAQNNVVVFPVQTTLPAAASVPGPPVQPRSPSHEGPPLMPVSVTLSYNKRTTPSREVTFLLVTVVLVAVFCQTPLAVFHFVRYAYDYHCGDTVFYLECFSKFLVNLNSCVNFVIYCLLSPKFRRMLSDTVTCRPRGAGRGGQWGGRGDGLGGAGGGNRSMFEFSVRESVKRRVR